MLIDSGFQRCDRLYFNLSQKNSDRINIQQINYINYQTLYISRLGIPINIITISIKVISYIYIFLYGGILNVWIRNFLIRI